MEAIITSVELGIPVEAVILNLGECLGQWATNSDPTTAKSHGVAEIGIGRMALGGASNVNHLGWIVIAENSHQIISIEDGVIVTQNEPAYIRLTQSEALSDNARDTESRRVTDGIGVAEAGDVLGNHDSR